MLIQWYYTFALSLQTQSKLASDQIEPISKMNDNLFPSSMEDDFASSIFSQLSPDLQQVLCVSETHSEYIYSVSCLHERTIIIIIIDNVLVQTVTIIIVIVCTVICSPPH